MRKEVCSKQAELFFGGFLYQREEAAELGVVEEASKAPGHVVQPPQEVVPVSVTGAGSGWRRFFS